MISKSKQLLMINPNTLFRKLLLRVGLRLESFTFCSKCSYFTWCLTILCLYVFECRFICWVVLVLMSSGDFLSHQSRILCICKEKKLMIVKKLGLWCGEMLTCPLQKPYVGSLVPHCQLLWVIHQFNGCQL